VEYLKKNRNFGMRIEISREECCRFGGCLKKAGCLFEDAGRLDEPFILHNVDVISTIDLGRMVHFMGEQKLSHARRKGARDVPLLAASTAGSALRAGAGGEQAPEAPLRADGRVAVPHEHLRRWHFPASTLFAENFVDIRRMGLLHHYFLLRLAAGEKMSLPFARMNIIAILGRTEMWRRRRGI